MNEKFLDNLETSVYGKCLHVFDEIKSTNTHALEVLEKTHIDEGTVFLALKQTDGQGSFGNKWESSKALGMFITIIAYEPYKQNPLSLVPAVALAKMLHEYYDIKAHLKWPNDVLVGDMKIAGILCQIKTAYNKKNACAIGIGLNIFQDKNDFSDDIKNMATSMKIISGKEYTLHEVYKNYMKCFEYVYNLETSIVSLWSKYSNMIGKNIKATKDGKRIEAYVNDITDDGYLEVVLDNKIEIWTSRANLDIDRFF